MAAKRKQKLLAVFRGEQGHLISAMCRCGCVAGWRSRGGGVRAAIAAHDRILPYSGGIEETWQRNQVRRYEYCTLLLQYLREQHSSTGAVEWHSTVANDIGPGTEDLVDKFYNSTSGPSATRSMFVRSSPD